MSTVTPDDGFDKNENINEDGLQSDVETKVTNKMEKWRDRYGYSSNKRVIEENDIFILLEAKEKDLILAAELGKSLLERNEELSKRNERIAESFSETLENLEQEKHQLKRQLEVAEHEYDQRILDLQGDITNLREVVDKHASDQRVFERQSSQLVSDLTVQNQRLTSQLRLRGANENELINEINQMKHQFSVRKTSIQEHFIYVETLREEISSVMSKKTELENQIRFLLEEKTNLANKGEGSSIKIRQMERKQKDQEHLARSREKDIEELRAGNHHLLDRLETMSRSRSSSPSSCLSLFSEMSGSDHEKSFCQKHFKAIEETDEDVELGGIADSDFEILSELDAEMKELKTEVLSAYHQLRNMCLLIRQREKKRKANSGYSMETSSSGSSEEFIKVKAGQLNQAVRELKSLLHHISRKQSRNSSSLTEGCTTCGRSLQEKENLEVELHQTVEQLDRGKICLKQAELGARRKDEEIQRIKSKLSLLEARLHAAEEERLILMKDVEEISLSKETLIRSAWSSRDSAVARKNVAEVELARGRIEGMQVSSQLMEAVQQKVDLSQQLDKWEVDMQVMLQEQVKDKLVGNSSGQSGKSSRSDSENGPVTWKILKPSSIMSFFSRS